MRARNPQRAANMPKTALRLVKMVFSFFPVLFPAVLLCICLQAVFQTLPMTYLQKAIAIVEEYWAAGDWADAFGPVMQNLGMLILNYVLGIICVLFWNQAMAFVTQGTLKRFRIKMFDHMQDLPIRYFDTHLHGDIMSYYTNDIDAMRQMISQSLPNLLLTITIMISVLCIMCYYSFVMAAVVLAGMLVMALLTRFLGGRSSKNFMRQQVYIAKVEGHVEEVMAGEKVIKVFCHEPQIKASFDELNSELEDATRRANSYANTLMPILMNLGNLVYVIVAMCAGIFLYFKVPNVSISGLPLSIAVVVPFLNMTKQFSGQIGQISNQINFVVMGLAGAERIFAFIDEAAEQDGGTATLIRVKEDKNGQLHTCEEHSGRWAWKQTEQDAAADPDHTPDAIIDGYAYTTLAGDVRLFNVDFAYEEGHDVLHDISLYAKPGQKVAFVGATGAGKTTITNIINRFYDIEHGKITYDGINISHISKPALRESLGMVLQDTNLFSGTILENIRYGKLDATDEECKAAARLAGADSFINRLPQGYETKIRDNGSNLSQGQRQLLSIARAAVENPPVLVLDEATSSIDTRTEAIVQRGMDALMAGRTTFVIAHRLSTVRNANVIIVLDHGRIIERGTHDELIAAKGMYYQLYTGAFELE